MYIGNFKMFTDFINQLNLCVENKLNKQRLQNSLLIIEILFGIIDILINIITNNIETHEKERLLSQTYMSLHKTRLSYESKLKHLLNSSEE